MQTTKAMGLGGLIGAGVVGILCFALGFTEAEEKGFSLEFIGLGSLSLETKDGKVDHETFLTEMFSKDFAKAGASAWLRENEQMYWIKDSKLPDALNKSLCDPIPESPLDLHIAAATACAEIAVADSLRELSASHKVPFHYAGKNVTIGIQGDPAHAPRPDFANACDGSSLSGKRVELTNLSTDNKITVYATGLYPCSGVGTTPDLQLNPDDAARLFDGPFRKFQSAVAVPLN